MITGSIYAIIRVSTGDAYVGRSCSPANRRVKHFLHLSRGKHHSPDLQIAYDEDGPEGLIFQILQDGFDSLFEMKMAERLWVRRMGTLNAMKVRSDGLQFTMSEGARMTIGRKSIAWWQKAAAENYKRPPVEHDFREKMREVTKSRWADPVKSAALKAGLEKSRLNHPGMGATKTPEAIAKRAESFKAIWADPDGPMRNRKSRWADPKQKAKQSAALKAAWAKRKLEALT